MNARSNMSPPQSCDTFVVLPPHTSDNQVIFGKNSDRPRHEVQEVVHFAGGIRQGPLKCTYIKIEESCKPLNAVILSKPGWMWGAEMGANDKNVVIGNEAVWTKNDKGLGNAQEKRLLGMDLVRLGLERGNTAEDSIDVITSLLEKYGQGGPCSEHDDSLFYHNSFLIADPTQAWVLETSGNLWAAEKVLSYRNISNGLTITTKIDKMSDGLKEKAQELGLWDGQGEFNFTKVFSSGGDVHRQLDGEALLRNGCKDSEFTIHDMFYVLRHKKSRICRGCDDGFPTQGSQVSILTENGRSVHWFTATPDPSVSLFKPFVFTPNCETSCYTESLQEPKHESRLYKLHADHIIRGTKSQELIRQLQILEAESIERVESTLRHYDAGENLNIDNLMEDYVMKEVKIYIVDTENE
ncbi:secernin-3 [Leguminivora glycinivorella]|uniref:secernin-3 n=1 Tax=Leguminivora glycinivorella TaxID=1035111 RepID=UPI00200D8A7B|nr:secernin-3 [Leguminivora glycinivorella]XP_048006208.1 secernin-3 [Leguminivora glycinivorella]